MLVSIDIFKIKTLKAEKKKLPISSITLHKDALFCEKHSEKPIIMNVISLTFTTREKKRHI